MIYIGYDEYSTYYLDGSKYYIEKDNKLVNISKEQLPINLSIDTNSKGSLFN